MRYRFEIGNIIVGKLGNTYLGIGDDRPMITIARSRSGKSSTVLEPNLYLYPGSMLVLDPKGELSRTARYRRAMGHNVYVWDPFGQSGEASASFNCLEELDVESPAVVDHAMSVVNALVPDQNEGGNSKHFNDCARRLLLGLILYTLTIRDPAQRNLITVRQLVTLSEPELVSQARQTAEKARKAAAARGEPLRIDVSSVAVGLLLERLVSLGSRFGGVAAAIGNSFLNTPAGERGSVFSTAVAHTDFLDSLPLREVIGHSDFRLSTLRADQPATIYLVLPLGELERQFRCLRTIFQLTCIVLERMGTYPRDRLPIVAMLEEFPVLKHMSIIESAIAYLPGFGLRAWLTVQSLEQLTIEYPRSYQTILGNCGLVQIFSAGDDPSLRYLASQLGKLMESFEMRQAFSRRKGSQLLMMEGEPPAAAMRLDHDDVALIRTYGARAIERRAISLR